jgi:aspartate aminotransferase
MPISKSISTLMKNSSWIRAMFEEGEKLKKKHGVENIYDFSLGNPITEPPEALKEELIRVASSDTQGMHRYMTNSGYDDVREEVAQYQRETTGLPFTKDNIVMTVGAAGGLNVVFKSILDPGDEVIVPCPFFVEFMFYIGNHNGVIKLVDTKDDFHLDIEKIKATINKKTKAILINSPHNPTGVVYHEAELLELIDLLHERSKKGQRIYIVADEAYKKIIYNGTKLPNLPNMYEDTVIVTCHSKDLGLAGERIGYIAMSPRIKNVRSLIDATIFANRILGFINAPAIMQRVVAKFQRSSVDITDYQKKRDAIYNILVESGFEVVKPAGAFYIFPKSPIPDDIQFVRTMLQHHILTVPGVGFGKPGYFRIAYCVTMDVIEKSRPYFKEVGELLRNGRR